MTAPLQTEEIDGVAAEWSTRHDEAQAPQSPIIANELTRYQGGNKEGSREPATRALPPHPKILRVRRKDEMKNCRQCGRGTHLRLIERFSDTGFLDVGSAFCQSCLKKASPEHRNALELYLHRQAASDHSRYGRQPYYEHCLSNLRDPGYE